MLAEPQLTNRDADILESYIWPVLIALTASMDTDVNAQKICHERVSILDVPSQPLLS
jgi:hypothetical protein